MSLKTVQQSAGRFKLVIRSGDSIEVLGGLDEYEQIVVTGQSSLRDGSRVFASIDTEGPVIG